MKGSLTRGELMQIIWSHQEILTKKEVGIFLDKFLEELIVALESGRGIHLQGFGSFRVKVRPPHKGRNPRTEETIDVPERKSIFFRVSPRVKKVLNPA
jgi:integration host factor subunit beta